MIYMRCAVKEYLGLGYAPRMKQYQHSFQQLDKEARENHSRLCFTATANFGASTAIPNTVDFCRRWSNLRGEVKSHNFPERIDARRQCFYFLYKYLGIIDRKRLRQFFWIMIWIQYYFFNRIRLDFELDNSYWIQKIANFATYNIKILCFYKPHIV